MLKIYSYFIYIFSLSSLTYLSLPIWFGLALSLSHANLTTLTTTPRWSHHVEHHTLLLSHPPCHAIHQTTPTTSHLQISLNWLGLYRFPVVVFFLLLSVSFLLVVVGWFSWLVVVVWWWWWAVGSGSGLYVLYLFILL